MTEKTQDQLVEQIVEQAAARAVDAVRVEQQNKAQEEATDREAAKIHETQEYIVKVKRRFWFPRKFRVRYIFEQHEVELQSGNFRLPSPRLVLHCLDGNYVYIPKLEKLDYSVYSKK